MKRDWDLLRKLLTEIEEDRTLFEDLSDKTKWIDAIQLKKEEDRQLDHLKLLIDGSFVEGVKVGIAMNGQYTISITKPRLTMSGYDLLDIIRSPTLWKKITSFANKQGLELTILLVQKLASKALDTMLP